MLRSLSHPVSKTRRGADPQIRNNPLRNLRAVTWTVFGTFLETLHADGNRLNLNWNDDGQLNCNNWNDDNPNDNLGCLALMMG